MTTPNPLVHELTARDIVFLTGATGFLGAELVRVLAVRRVRVHALVRDAARAEHLSVGGNVAHAGDLTDVASVERALAAAAHAARTGGGRLYVIHSGALISYRTRERALAERINVDGTRAMLAAARAHGAARFLFVSSVVAVGQSTDGGAIDERAPFNLGHLGVHYTDTKRAAEELALAARDLDVVVVNPGAIFGPAERASNTVRFMRQMAAGRGPVAAPPGTISVVGIADTAAGTLAALERGRRGERYILVESFVSSRRLFALIAAELGVRPARFTVPRWFFPVVVPLARIWDTFFPIALAPPQALVMLTCELRLSGDKARRELGWQPRPFEVVLHETIAALRARGELPAAS